ncbi:MAG: copper-binding protein [Rhodocyclaceae bacterium]
MKILPVASLSVTLVLSAFGTSHVFAQAGHAGHHRGDASAAAPADAAAPDLAEGTVRRVNAGAGTVTIAHGPLARLDMPPMTMSFRVSGEASLEGLSVGDKIRFVADKDGDEFIVTAIEKVGD